MVRLTPTIIDAPAPRGQKSRFILPAVSFDDDSTDDSAGFRPPPHPDDRLWRHPSELHRAARRRAGPTAAHSPWGTAAVAAAGVALVAAGASVVTLGLRDRAAEQDPLTQAAISPPDSDGAGPPEYTIANLDQDDPTQLEVVRKLAPSVVRVDSGATRGSGVIISDDGVLLTSAAVVGDQPDVAVALGDGRLLTGQTIGTDPLTGVALVDLPGDGYTGTELSDVPLSDVGGESALALGVDETGRLVLGAGGLAATPSYVDRPGLPRLDGVLVIDTVVDPVALGGPVVDDTGTLIGLATWTNGTQSHVTPISTLRKVVDDLLTTGTVQHTFMGIDGYDKVENEWPVGVGVDRVDPAGPSAGVLQTDDVIVAIDQHLVSHMSALVIELRRHDPGDVVQLSYRRAGHDGALTQPVVLAQRPASLDL
jgi:S1-C subfamily serine protease